MTDDNGRPIEKVYTVGRATKDMLIRCYNEKDNMEVDFNVPSQYGSKKLTSVVELQGPLPENMEDYELNKRARNLVVSSDDGRLFIYGTPPFLKKGRECEVMNSHIGSINCIKRSYDFKILVSVGDDGTVFVYRVGEVPNTSIGNYTKKINEKIENYERELRKKKQMKD